MARLNYAKASRQPRCLIAKARRYYAADSQDRRSERYWLWRKAVLKRDKYQCQDCKGSPPRLIAHHIKTWYDYPQYRFSRNNGIILCEDCHLKLHPWVNPQRHKEIKAVPLKPQKVILRRP